MNADKGRSKRSCVRGGHALVSAYAMMFVALLDAGAVLAQLPPSADRESVQRLDWLSGCWEQRSSRRVIEEQWMAPRGGIMLGMSRTLRGDSVVAFEHTRVFERSSHLVFHALPSGQTPAEFVSTIVTDTSVTFENLTHDFPQRVLYRRVTADSVAARVEGVQNGKLGGIDFGYRRTQCGPPARK